MARFNRLMAFTILLVDDNPVQAATRQAILSSCGNQVSVASSARQALTLLEEDPGFAGNVRLVITDHLMPKMNGPQFVVRLRQRFPALPILVLSGLPDAEMEYAELNILYRPKPIAPEELIRLTELLCRDTLQRTA
jgi:CheY-like chemotaxis protein